MRVWAWSVVWMICAAATGCGLLLDLEPPSSTDASVLRDAGTVAADAGRRDGALPDGALPDGAPPDSAACLASAEVCNSRDDDCDGFIDEDFDLDVDPETCGSCDIACPTLGGAAFCNRGECRLVCDADRADCDSSPDNGCETDIGLTETCGSCDNDCSLVSLPDCQLDGLGFVCAESCDAGSTSCGGLCIDPLVNDENCGDCGAACFNDIHGDVGCEAGRCVVRDCGDNRRDCNLDPADGCEQQLGTLMHCRACGDACEETEFCSPGGCTPS